MRPSLSENTLLALGRKAGEERELDHTSRYTGNIIGISTESYRRSKEPVSCTKRAAAAAE
jgi:hypothetical protein